MIGQKRLNKVTLNVQKMIIIFITSAHETLKSSGRLFFHMLRPLAHFSSTSFNISLFMPLVHSGCHHQPPLPYTTLDHRTYPQSKSTKDLLSRLYYHIICCNKHPLLHSPVSLDWNVTCTFCDKWKCSVISQPQILIKNCYVTDTFYHKSLN